MTILDYRLSYQKSRVCQKKYMEKPNLKSMTAQLELYVGLLKNEALTLV